MQLVESFIRNPVKVSVGVLLTVMFGSICLIRMPKQLAPEVQNPVLSIETRWPGGSPQEVEREIVQEQEEQLQSTEGLIKMTSECLDSSARITLEFVVGTDIEDAMLRISTRLQQVREYPVDSTEPVIRASNVSDSPIARFVLTARPPELERIVDFQRQHTELAEHLEPARKAMNTGLRVFRLQQAWKLHGDQHPELKDLLPPDLDLQQLRKFSEDVIETRLERVPGVSDAYTYGGRQEELQVIVDPDRLAARQLTIGDIRNALRSQNKDTSGGDFWEGKRRWVIRTLNQFRDPEQVKQQVLAVRDGAPIYVRDVADVKIGFKKTDSVSRRYGISSNGLAVRRSSGANVLSVMDGIHEAATELNSGVLKQRGLELYQYYDETEYIHSAIGLVQQNIFIGGALTMIVLLLFLHLGQRTLLVVPLIAASAAAAAYLSSSYVLVTLALVVAAGFWFGRGALVVGLAIPVSVIGTFLLLGLMGRSLNVISLAGLAFAVGMLVDNAVVVLENIFRRYETGEDAVRAAVNGTKEVMGAVVASTLTTIAVFVPVLFVEEMAGQLFRDIALAISCAVGLSLVISFTVVPTAASRLFRRRIDDVSAVTASSPRVDKLSSRGLPDVLRTAGSRCVDLVIAINRWTQRGTTRSLAVVALMVGASVGVSYWFWPKVEYLPSGNRNFVFCSVSPPPGYNMDQLMAMGAKIEDDLKPYWNADPGSPEADELEYPVINYYFYVVRGRQVFMGFRADDENRVRELIPLIKGVGSQFPGTMAVAKQSSLFERGLTGGRTIDIEITGPDLEQLVAIGGKVLADVKKLLPEAQAMPRPSLDLSGPEIHIEPRLMESSEMGINASDLGYTVDALIDGAYAGDFFSGGDKIDLTIMGHESFAQRTQDLNELPISTANGQLVPLSAVADVSLSSGPEQINRRERQRAITIQVTPPVTMPLEDAMQQINASIVTPLHDTDMLEGGYLITLSGTADKLRLAWSALKWNLLMALAITYLLMAALFESWLYPFVIIFSVPLGAVGGIVGLTVLNLFVYQSLDVLTMLGFVILIGTVVNNAILIVHQSLNHMRLEGLTPREAIPLSIRTRVRPIFITTLTTVLGLLPLVAFPGAGSELYRGLGSVVLGGLLVSTVFTLFLVPTVFILMLDAKYWIVGVMGLSTPELLTRPVVTSGDG
ncbi:MAG: efflux RND transporter permease subunit [Fuerstiella sp.]|jgi:HAE1 family hydrophobic/amphiphilic exporter-1|nr:efflux RND transporter permease subunit [Fuerstiella sp.]